MKLNYKKLLISIGIPLVLGFIVGMISGSGKGYSGVIQPSFAPPGWLFPVVWTILYILMGIGDYLVKESEGTNKSLEIYKLQLAVNLIWSFLFFTFKWYLISFLWIILLIVLVVKMIREFNSINSKAGKLQIPYLLWIIFAGILNFSIYILN